MGKTRKIRAKDDHSLVWDNEDLARRAIITPLLHNDFKDRPEDMKEYYKELMKLPIDQLVGHKDTAGSWEFVPEDEDATPNNWKWRDLYNNDSPYGNDLEDAIDEWEKEGEEPKIEKPEVKDIDTNDNGKVEVDELDAYTKDLEDYLDKNPDAKKKNYY